jgi:hypothetical protein
LFATTILLTISEGTTTPLRVTTGCPFIILISTPSNALSVPSALYIAFLIGSALKAAPI